MLNFSSRDIDNLLYSALRSKKHLRVRQKSYFKRAIKLVYLYLVVPVKEYKGNKKVVLNYLSASYLDFSELQKSQHQFQFDLEENQLKPLYIVEGLLILAFLLNLKFIQKPLLKWAGSITRKVLETRKVELLICGHPDLLISFLGYCLKSANKDVLTVQHGIYNLTSYKVLWWEKYVANKIILYGEDFRKLYVSQGVDNEKIIIGNPFFGSVISSTDKNQNVNLEIKNKKVIFLGQQLYKISASVYTGYNDFISNFIDYFTGESVEVFYKPHPREEISKSLNASNISKLNFYSEKGKPLQLFTDFDFYYSVNSSILIELYLQKKICFQVDIPIDDFNYDNFRDYTGIPMVNITTLREHLNSNEYKFHYDPNYLNIKNNYTQYMIGLIKGIIENSLNLPGKDSHSVKNY